MTLTDLLTACWRADITLTVADEYIDIDAPAGALTPQVRGALRHPFVFPSCSLTYVFSIAFLIASSVAPAGNSKITLPISISIASDA